VVTLTLRNAGKKFLPGWVFRNLSETYSGGDRVAVTGYNGSGKSTFMRLVAGMTAPDEGSVVLADGDGPVDGRRYYRHIAFSAPYVDLIEDLTPAELLRFYGRFREAAGGDVAERARQAGLDLAADKRIRDLSSGMKQRLKLVLALCFRADVVLLDEPGSNLDEAGLGWLQALLDGRGDGGILFIATNDPAREAVRTNRTLHIPDHIPAS